jgi:hypothetical protein
MGFLLSILYFAVNYLTPSIIFGPLAVARIELILAILIFFVSLPKLTKSIILKTSQSLALIGLALAASLSVLIEARWIGGAVQALLGFIPNVFAYFLVCLHCDSKRKLQFLIFMLLFVCLFVIGHGYLDLRHGVPENGAFQPSIAEDSGLDFWDLEHPYLVPMKNNSGEWIYRLRGLGLIHDPNDFAQLIVCIIPLVFIFWRRKKMFQNTVFVTLPVCALLFGAFLTHSRGALLALIAVTVLAARRRIGTPSALLIAGGVFVAAMALHFTGGREISADAGADRTTLWSEGLQLLKSHPLFGVGLGRMAEYTDSQHTAHNSVVVCAAELGLVGLYFWAMFLFPTVRDALTIASTAKVGEAETTLSDGIPFPVATRKIEIVDKVEVNRTGRLLVLSLTGFLVAGWFLSRAFVLTFFLLGGVTEVVFEMALRQGMIVPRLPLTRVLQFAGGLAVLLVLLMYVMLRVTNLMH